MPPKKSKGSSFPAARIKRIMQQDDDVGKVAGGSPPVVSKAVELFLQEMLQAIEKEARSKGTRKVSMFHVKRAVQNTPSLDFLKDLVATIPDPSADDADDPDFTGPGGSGSGGEKKTRKPRAKKAPGASLGGAPSNVGAHMHGSNGASGSGSQAESSNGGGGVRKINVFSSSVPNLAPISVHQSAPAQPSVLQHAHLQPSASSSLSSAALGQPQQQHARAHHVMGPKVSIPISSLLSNDEPEPESAEGPDYGQQAKAEPEAVDPPTDFPQRDDDDYDGDDDMKEEGATSEGLAKKESPAPALAATRQTEEDEDYD